MKSDVIVRPLQGHRDMLNTRKASVETKLTGTLTEREQTVSALEAVRSEVAGMDARIIALENKISVEEVAAARTRLETELAALNERYNALVQDEQVKISKSQTLERDIKRARHG